MPDKHPHRRLARPIACAVFLATSFAFAGCTSYYAIDDPSTDRTYYTTKYKTKGGALVFRDHATGKQVNIQNGEVLKISKSQYKAGTH